MTHHIFSKEAKATKSCLVTVCSLLTLVNDQKIILTRIYGHLRWPFFSPFGYGRVLELFMMTNICNGNKLEGMTIFGRNDTNLEGMTLIWKE